MATTTAPPLKEKRFKPIKMPAKKTREEKHSNHEEDQEDKIRLSITKEKSSMPHVKKVGLAKDHHNASQDENIEFQGKVDNQTLAMEILKGGFIQSYIDFFYITNSSLPKLIQVEEQVNDDIFGQKENETKFENKEENLIKLKTSLMRAEENTRYPDKSPALEDYHTLAENFFEEYNDFQGAAYFYKRCIEISKLVSDKSFEVKSRLGFGKCHDRLGKTEDAIKIFEMTLEEAEANSLSNVVVLISRELIDIYHKIASNFESEENESTNSALMYYEKCLEVARKAGEREAEGSICNKIGFLHSKNQDFDKSIEFQHKYLQIARETNNDAGKTKQMEARSALAKCYLQMGNTDEAQNHLEQYHNLAKELRMNNSQSDAALHLARLYMKKKNIPKSLEYYQQHFDCARTEKPELRIRSQIDQARVIYGIAKANANIESFIKLISNSDKNIKPLLDWKAKKDK